MAEGAEAEREHARLGPQAVAVEGDRGVEDGGDGERGERVGRFGVGVFGRDACGGSVSWGAFFGGGERNLLAGCSRAGRSLSVGR